ncbi:hypothetical protein QQS21_004998 [Conoideocrella luteorostrata]|uniref:SHSP domain-containing protein n=1 Tax=Conoideocrella luteorostrata TaxID=1105319 RepID=A0AAJ0CTB8_9HYPO|nr:hypothetical protein QQS21_004998 [Conoideocrella luteorostrata]
MSSQDQQHQPPIPSGPWDFLAAFGGQNNSPGQGVDHHNPPSFPFSGAFPFGGPMGHQPPHSRHPPPPFNHHGPHGIPHHRGPPPGPGVGPSPWGESFDWSDWYNHDHDHDEHGHGGGRERRRERRECRRRNHQHRHFDDGTDEDSNQSGGGKDAGNENGNEEKEQEKGASPDTVDADMPDPDEVALEDGEYPPPPYGRDFGGRRGRGRFGRGGGGWHRGRGMHHGGRHYPRGGGGSGFDFGAIMRGFMNHPFFQNMRDQAERYRSGGNNSNNNNNNQSDGAESFAPPVDIFNTERAFVVHVALPGAKKEDVGVDWNPDNNTLSISGVVHRPGDEDFIQGLVSSERRVGLFERNITLPPPGVASSEKEDVDGFSITAKMEDGVLVVTVPKMEKEWTEIRKVDIQ